MKKMKGVNWLVNGLKGAKKPINSQKISQTLFIFYRDCNLVRETLSFSKKVESHIGAIWYFIHDYNAMVANSL